MDDNEPSSISQANGITPSAEDPLIHHSTMSASLSDGRHSESVIRSIFRDEFAKLGLQNRTSIEGAPPSYQEHQA